MQSRRCLAVAALALLTSVARAQTPALGPTFQVNTYTDTSRYPHVAMNSAGDFVVCWNSEGQDGDSFGAFEQFYPKTGVPPAETQVDTETAAIQWNATAAVGEAGDFVVAWTTNTTPGTTQNYSVRFRRFDKTGAPVSAPTPIVDKPGFGDDALVTIMPGGDFLVVWDGSKSDGTSRGVSAQRFDADGGALGGVFQVNSYTTGLQSYPTLAHDASGNFVVAWGSESQDASDYGIFAQRFDASGTKVGPEFQVNTYTTGVQNFPSVGMDAAGNFVVAWQSYGQDGGGYAIFGQRFDASGNKRGGEIEINTSTVAWQTSPSVAMDSAGDFLVAWENWSGVGISARRFSAAGARLDSVFAALPGALRPSLTLGSSDEAIVVGHVDGNIVARHLSFGVGKPMAVDAHGTGATSNLNGVLEPGETVQVEPAWKKLTAASFTGFVSNLTGPQGPIYTLDDAGANYASADPAGSVVDCFHASGDCYSVAISGARPSPHWDATFDEALDNDLSKTWTLHVGESFPDVPVASPFYPSIENVFHNGVTGGCGGGNYCPASSVTRAQMAVFLLRAKHGAAFAPAACAGVFDDVACPSLFADWIEALAAEGITAGCGGVSYCPDNPVTRAQMAVFLLKAEHGSDFTPASCQGVFEDVACPSPIADWIEALAGELITSGCGGGNYCPSNPNTRGQMAVFLVKTFGLQLYGP